MWGDTIQADIFTQWLQKIASITLAFAELLTVASGMGDAWLRSALLVSTCGKTSPWQERLMLATHQKCSAEVALFVLCQQKGTGKALDAAQK